MGARRPGRPEFWSGSAHQQQACGRQLFGQDLDEFHSGWIHPVEIFHDKNQRQVVGRTQGPLGKDPE